MAPGQDTLRILHISDLHLTNKFASENSRYVIKALIIDIQKLSKEKNFDLVIFSGDLVNQGGIDFGDCEIAFLTFEEEVIIPIMDAIGLPKDRFFFTPGNHDIVRSADSPFIESGLKSQLTNCDVVNDFIENQSTTGEGIQRLNKYNSFEDYFYGKSSLKKQITKFDSSFVVDVNGLSVGISSLNSAWRCYGNDDKENLIIGEKQLIRSLDFLEDCELKIVLVHHNFDWLAEFDREVVEPIITREYQLMFSGHVHKGNSTLTSKVEGELFISVASGSLSQNTKSDSRKYSNGYNVVDYNIKDKSIVTSARRYSPNKNIYDPNTDLGDEFGQLRFHIPNRNEISSNSILKTLRKNIENSQIDDLNTHLLSYGTDTTAPQNLKEIFVLPKIVDGQKEPENEKIYNFDDLINSEYNYILLAGKEYGKTVFLDRLLIEILDGIEDHKKIPVYVNLNELGNSEVKSVFKKFLNVNSEKLEELLANYSFILLVDNLSVDSNEYGFRRLEKFLIEFPHIRTIATFNQLNEEDIPVQIVESKYFYQSKILKIESFKSEHIRQLIKKWFSKESSSDLPDKLEKLANVFQALNLPRTPLAVSIFLWIIEKQVDYRPVNNSTMLENFIERIFKKLDKDEVYSERFDFRNKERLLADIAYFMYQNNNEHYSLEFSDLLIFIKDYLKCKRFDFQADRILNIFLIKGVLIREGELVRFRFPCFFQFFLMKKMDFDPKFKAYVLDPDNYLKFIDEIDYFTGIKRDQVEIMDELIKRMELTFQSVSNYIDDLGIDSIFHNDESMLVGNDVPETIKRIKDKKPKNEQIDQMKDDAFDKIEHRDNGIQKKEEKLNKIQILGKNWMLASKVLKNTEEVDLEGFKDKAYSSILKCSNTYAALYKIYCDIVIEKHIDTMPDEWIKFFMMNSMFVPVMHEHILFKEMGTAKLSLVINDKIEEDFKRQSVSEFERFISVFLYADIKGKNNLNIIKRFIDTAKEKYIRDMCFFKIMQYYYTRNNSKEVDEFYEAQIANILIKSKGADAGRLRENLIKQYRQKKETKLNRDKDQLNLNL